MWSILGSTLAAFCCFPGQKTKSFQSTNMVFLCKQHSQLQSILRLLTEISQVISQLSPMFPKNYLKVAEGHGNCGLQG